MVREAIQRDEELKHAVQNEIVEAVNGMYVLSTHFIHARHSYSQIR